MRLTEQFTVTWSQVHLDRRTIELTKTKNGSARTVHLNVDAEDVFERLSAKKHRPNDRVWPSENKQITVRAWFPPAMEKAKIEGYVWHSNRHTFCSWLAMAGASIKEIQEAAGHKSIMMSARYSHLSPEHRLSIVDRIATSVNAQA
jgi:site-specific recombinase XerD